MRDDDPGAAHSVKGVRDLLLRDVVERRSSFVKEQKLRLWGDCPRDHDALLLASGDSAAAFLQHSAHSHGHCADVVRDPGDLRRVPGLLESQVWRRDCNILENAAAEELTLLQHGSDQFAKGPQIQRLDILAVVEDRARFRLFEAQQQTQQRRLAAAGLAYDRHILARGNLQAQVVDDLAAFLLIAESYM